MIITPARKTADTITDNEVDALYALHDQVVRLHVDDGHGYCTACRLTPSPCPTRRAVEQPTPVDDALTDDDVTVLDAATDGAYRERAALLAWLAETLPAGDAVLTPAPDVGIPGWLILFMSAHGRQLSWHIAPRDAGLFDGLEVVEPEDRRAMWDGHSTPEKYERIGDIVRELRSRCGPECDEMHRYAGRCAFATGDTEAADEPGVTEDEPDVDDAEGSEPA